MICKKQTCVMVSQFIDMESDSFHGRLPSNKIPETGFHQQTVKTVAYRLDELMTVLQPGDQLVVTELSRLGRSLGQIVAILDALAKEPVSFIAIKENIRVEGK